MKPTPNYISPLATGYAAWLAGKSRKDNPFKDDTDDYDLWDQGWVNANAEDGTPP